MFALSLSQNSLFAQEHSKTPEIIPEAYPKNYFLLQANSNLPQGKSRERFSGGDKGFGVSYSYALAKRLIVGVNFKDRVFIKKNGTHMTLMTFGNHTQGVFRIYHPLYLLVGTEWNYMIPTLSMQLPVIKDPDYTTEVGVGGSAALWYYLSPKWLAEGKVMRWKGTKTSRLEGWDFTVSVGFGF